MKKEFISLMIFNWCWFLATIINKDFGWIYYVSLILGFITTNIVFWENKK